MLLAHVVETSNRLRATRSRRTKTELLAARLGELTGPEIEIGISFLAGEPRQARLGVGYRTLSRIGTSPASEPELTLSDVDEKLQNLAATTGPGSNKRREALLTELMGRATAEEQAFLRGLVLRELRQGALEGIMVEALGRAAGIEPEEVRRAVMLSGSLTEAGKAILGQGADAIGTFGLALFTPVKPMLAQTADSVSQALVKMGKASVETKFDGARIQVHRRGDELRVYTRNLRDITGSVPELVAVARAVAAQTYILDGEAMSFWGNGRPQPFQETISRFSQEEATGGLAAVFFDCLHLEGRDLIDLPARVRFDALSSVVPEEVLVPRLVTSDPEKAEGFYEKGLAEGHEGVMVKNLDAPYEAGRRGAAWLKVKPSHTLDLVVLAVEWGSGRRKGWLSNLHLGARDPDTGSLVMLGKTFKGLTDEMLEWQTRRFLALERDRDAWTVYVRPEQVVEIAFDSVQASPRYPGGVALRFARVKRYRDDKTAAEADTIDTVRGFWKGR